MAVKTMADWLSVEVADYTAETYDLAPQSVMPEEGEKNQIMHRYDDRTIRSVSISPGSFFTVVLVWKAMSTAKNSELQDLYHNALKANGTAKTWYWKHPLEDNVYVVRFLGPLTRVFIAGLLGYQEVQQIRLNVEGVKA